MEMLRSRRGAIQHTGNLRSDSMQTLHFRVLEDHFAFFESAPSNQQSEFRAKKTCRPGTAESPVQLECTRSNTLGNAPPLCAHRGIGI